MTFFKRWKKSADFRRNVIIGIVIIFFISNYTDIGKKEAATFPAQSVCDTCAAGLLNFCSIGECLALGCVGNGPEVGEDFGLDIGVDCKAGLDIGDEVCINDFQVTDNSHVYTSDGSKMCKSGNARFKDYKFLSTPCGGASGNTWMCISAVEAAERGIASCKPWQQPFADFLGNMWEGAPESCQTRATLAMGALAFAVVAVI